MEFPLNRIHDSSFHNIEFWYYYSVLSSASATLLGKFSLVYIQARHRPITGGESSDALSGTMPYKFQPLKHPENSNSCSSSLHLPVLYIEDFPRHKTSINLTFAFPF